MKTNTTLISKITPPNSSGVFLRKRLITHLDAGRRQPVIWVSGPAGSGKTTLVSSYLDSRKLPCLWYRVDAGDTDIATFFYYLGLAAKKAAPRSRQSLPLFTPEYLPGVSVFTRRFFEKLYERLQPPCALVFDNYQDAPLESGFHEAMREGLSLVPEGITVMVISRNDPPAAFARLRAEKQIAFLGWKEIRFTPAESRKLIGMHRPGRLTNDALAEVQKKTEGWAAGLVLIAESAKARGLDRHLLETMMPEEIFDYFGDELLKKTDEEKRLFLLKTAFLPKMTASTAELLTGVRTAERILSQLSRDNYFTEKHILRESVYRYHPLFREFLVHQAQELFSKGEILRLQKRAAELLEQSGHYEDAAELFRRAEDWNGFARLVRSCAEMMIAQGRTQTLEGWLRSFPEPYREQAPWLLYLLGTCAVSMSPAGSQPFFERAFLLFKARKDGQGVFLAWSGVVGAICLGWGEFTQADSWIEMLGKLLRQYPEPFTAEIEARVTTSMLLALTLRQPDHRDISAWVKRAHIVVQRDDTGIRLKSFINVYLGLYYLWIGDHGGAEVVIKGVREAAASPDALPLAQILGRLMEAVYQVRIGRHDLCRSAVVEGLALAASTGVVIWNSQLYSQGAMNALSEGNPAEAAEYLQKMSAVFLESRRVDACMYHYSTAWEALLRRELPRAAEHAEAALRFALEAGTPFHEGISRVALAQVLHEQGEDRKAAANLAQAHRIAAQMKSRILDFMVLVCRSLIALDEKDRTAALNTLSRTMALGREQGYTNFYWWRHGVMSRLCARALEGGIEIEYVQNLIRKRSLRPIDPSLTHASWPWPIKIYTLGRFELVRDGEPVRFAGKVQQKPLALLKALIALGGRSVAEERLTDLLWPDADGDLAHKSFDMTVIRLRKLIGHDNAVQIHERQLSLDDRVCWVDVRALEDVLARTEAAWNKGATTQGSQAETLRLCDKAFELYQGHFLPADIGHSWALSSRERLRSKFHRLIVKLGEYLGRQGQWERAAEVFQKGLETDSLAEELHLHLMICYQQLGRKAEALAVYNRCRELLLSSLGVSPSPKMEEVYKTLKAATVRQKKV